ncbi:MAG TPA: hypothetical protein VD968_01740 [Pyrinomonadaceae bacterium]|nr:hypothetical protein [Pyrinomonadaceae bacterium]
MTKVTVKEELRARVLAMVLAAVLVWYTSLVPAGAPARVIRPRSPEDDEGRGGESRPRRAPQGEAIEELDWPEYIGLD